MPFISKSRLRHIRSAELERGRAMGTVSHRPKGWTMNPQHAPIRNMVAYADMGCPICKKSIYAIWWAQDHVGVVVFEFSCGTMASCNGSAPKITSDGIGHKEKKDD